MIQKVSKKRGAKPIPRDIERYNKLTERLKVLRITPQEIYMHNKEFFSKANLCAKLRGEIGITENEYQLIEKTIGVFERKVLKAIGR